MNYILLHWSYGRKSIEMTIEKMTEPCNLIFKKNSGEWFVYSPATQNMEEETQPCSLHSVMNILTGNNKVINWGNHIFSNDEYFSLNKPSTIAIASNKARSRRYLQESGVKVPKSYFWENLAECTEVKYPIIVRPAHHHGGQNFNVFQNPQTLAAYLWGKQMGTWYAAEVFPKTTEFRVHVGHGKVLFIQEKPLVKGEIRANQAVNHESWRVLKWSEFHPGVCQESIKAIGELGLDYGAVDIMYNAPDDTWAICEVNTSPSINTPYSSEKYAAYFSWVIRHDFPKHLLLEDGTNVFYSAMLRE